MDAKFAAQDYNDAAFEPAALTSAVLSLANLGAYAPATSLMSAEASYYATAGYNGDASTAAATTTVAASSSGYGFASTTATASTKVAAAQHGKATTAHAQGGKPTHKAKREFTA